MRITRKNVETLRVGQTVHYLQCSNGREVEEWTIESSNIIRITENDIDIFVTTDREWSLSGTETMDMKDSVYGVSDGHIYTTLESLNNGRNEVLTQMIKEEEEYIIRTKQYIEKLKLDFK